MRYFLLILMFITGVVSPQASAVLEINEEHDGDFIGKHVRYYEDKTNTVAFEDVKSSDFQSRFVPSEKEVLNFGYTNSSYWLTFTLQNTSPHKDWVITLDYAVLDHVTLYYQDENGDWKSTTHGDREPLESKEFEQRFPVFSLPLQPGQEGTFFMKVETEGSYQIGMELQRQKHLYEEDIRNELGYGIYFGVLLIMLLYNFFLFFTIKDLNYIYYVMVILSNLMFFSSISGHSYLHVWNESPLWGGLYAVPFSMGMLTFWTAVFANNFLLLRKYSKPLFYLMRVNKALGIGVMIATFTVSYGIVGRTAAAINIITAISVFAAGIIALIRGNKAARYYVIAWSAYLLGAIILVLKTFGALPPNFFTVHAVQIGSIMEAFLLSFALGDKYNLYRKEKNEAQKKLLEVEREAKENLERKVEERTIELRARNKEIETKNRQITSSIQYAKYLQEAVLPEREYFNGLLPDSFVFYRPKDIVSGDFYWCDEKDGKVLFAAVDCTGHGVPGAFVSLIGHNSLTRAVRETDRLSAAAVLELTNEFVLHSLRSRSENIHIQDGMDIALCVWDKEAGTIEFAGAMNPLYIARNGEMLQLNGDRCAIGGQDDFTFTNHTVNLQKGDTLFVFSDGYADQFGGPKSRKMNYRRFREILLEVAEIKESGKQQEIIAKRFDEWKGTEEQIDDVCIIGLNL